MLLYDDGSDTHWYTFSLGNIEEIWVFKLPNTPSKSKVTTSQKPSKQNSIKQKVVKTKSSNSNKKTTHKSIKHLSVKNHSSSNTNINKSIKVN